MADEDVKRLSGGEFRFERLDVGGCIRSAAVIITFDAENVIFVNDGFVFDGG